jgi:hypothetical protein
MDYPPDLAERTLKLQRVAVRAAGMFAIENRSMQPALNVDPSGRECQRTTGPGGTTGCEKRGRDWARPLSSSSLRKDGWVIIIGQSSPLAGRITTLSDGRATPHGIPSAVMPLICMCPYK